MIPDQYPNYYKAVEFYTGYFKSGYNNTFFLSQQYRNNERALYFLFGEIKYVQSNNLESHTKRVT